MWASDENTPRAGVMSLDQLESRTLLSAPAKVAPEPAPLPGNQVRVYAPDATVRGLTMGQWSAEWWKWAWNQPEDKTNNGLPNPVYENPLYDDTGAQAYLGRQDNMFFIGGVFRIATDPPTATTLVRERNVTIPTGTPIFFPLYNGASSPANPNRPSDPEALQALVRAGQASVAPYVDNWVCTLNGVALTDLASRYVESGIFDVTFVHNNIYNIPDDRLTNNGEPWIAASAGYWVMLQPLPPGQYELHFLTGWPGVFQMDITYNITIVPQGQYNKIEFPVTTPSVFSAKPVAAAMDLKEAPSVLN